MCSTKYNLLEFMVYAVFRFGYQVLKSVVTKFNAELERETRIYTGIRNMRRFMIL